MARMHIPGGKKYGEKYMNANVKIYEGKGSPGKV